MRPLLTTITAAAPDRNLVSLDDLREQLRVRPGDTANDAWLTKVIGRASRQAERYCNRIFAPQDYLDTFAAASGSAGEPLILSVAPIDADTLVVTLDGGALAATDVALDSYAGLLYRTSEPMRWSAAASLTVAYTAGYDPIPPDVEQAVLDLCTMENAGRGRDPMLRASETPGLGRQEYWVGGMPGGATIPQDIAALLNPYRRGLVG